MKTMSFIEKNKLFILVHGEDPPSDPEWEEYTAASESLKVLLGTTPLPTAVITTSQIARAIAFG